MLLTLFEAFPLGLPSRASLLPLICHFFPLGLGASFGVFLQKMRVFLNAVILQRYADTTGLAATATYSKAWDR